MGHGMKHGVRWGPALLLIWVVTLLASWHVAAQAAPVTECPRPVVKVRSAALGQAGPVSGPSCFAPPLPDRTCLKTSKLCDKDMAVARIAWKYFENNYNPKTGLVNAADSYHSTTMWDAGSSLMALIAAKELGLIDRKVFDDRVTALLKSLTTQKLYKGEAPNKAYNSETGEMADYTNKPTEGIGFSALDLGRMASALNALGCMHSQHAHAAKRVLERWSYCRMIKKGQMYGAFIEPAKKQEMLAQEGRLGYEQYAGRVFDLLGFDQSVSSTYKNEYASSIVIYDVPIAVDLRDPRVLGAYNYVVTESYALDAMENGVNPESAQLLKNIFEVQRRRWQRTDIVTAVSEDNVDRAPYFVYNTIYAAGTPWAAITDTGKDQSALRSVSTKAAFSLITLFPRDPYSSTLSSQIASAYDPEKGWYSGVYESGIGYNKVITANTNGIILEALLYKMMGPIHSTCRRCGKVLKLEVPSCGCTSCDK